MKGSGKFVGGVPAFFSKAFHGIYFGCWLLVFPAVVLYGTGRHLDAVMLLSAPIVIVSVMCLLRKDVMRATLSKAAGFPGREIGRKTFVAAVSVMAVLQLACQVYFASEMAMRPTSDRMFVYGAAAMIADSGEWRLPGDAREADPAWVYDSARTALGSGSETLPEDAYAAYFSTYGNNVPFLAATAALFKILSALGLGAYRLAAQIVLNVSAIDAAIAMAVILAYRIYGRAGALCLQAGCLLSMPLYAYTVFVYTDTAAMPFIMGTMLAYHSMLRSLGAGKRGRAVTMAVLAGASACLGFQIKATAAIALAACCICMLMRKYYVQSLSACASFALCLSLCGAGIRSLGIVDYGYAGDLAFPYAHWVMMGLNDDFGYNEEDALYTASFPDKDAKAAADLDRALERLAGRGVPGSLFFQYAKTAYIWGDGEYAMGLYASRAPLKDSWLRPWFQREGDTLRYHVQGLYAHACHCLALIFLARSLRRGMRDGAWDEAAAWKLSLFGLAAFLSIWEAMPRYAFQFYLILLLAALDGFAGSGPRSGASGRGRFYFRSGRTIGKGGRVHD